MSLEVGCPATACPQRGALRRRRSYNAPMPWPRGRGTLAAVASVAGCIAGAWIGACGLPQSGLSASLDDGGGRDGTAAIVDGSRTPDGPGDGETGASPACAPDAGCLGALPTGWRPVGVSDAGCAAGFTAMPLLVNPRLADGGCACGACQTVGSFACSGGVAVSGGDNCADPTLVTVTPGTCAAASAQHVEAHPPQATGSVACTVANDAGTGALTDTLTVCVPGCSVDYCQTAQRCVEAEGDLACPSGFTLLARAGTGADPGCAPCACEAGPPGTCGGTVTVYDNGSCADSGGAATYAVGGCTQYSTSSNYQSVLVELVAPDASCSAQTAVEGDASLTGVKTICCE